jgi:sec-independent protein translocase protein TatA
MRIPSGWELVVIVLVVVLLFGAKKMPDAARGLGRSLRIFKAEVSSLNDDDKDDVVTPPSPVLPPQAITGATAVSPMAAPAPLTNGVAVPVPPPVEHPVTAPVSSESNPAER